MQITCTEEPCGNFKYNDNVCANRKFKASWHPGWRVHALTGNLLGVQISEIVIEILREWQGNDEEDPFALYERLQKEEDEEYKKFYATTVPDVVEGMAPETFVTDGLKSNDLFRKKSICHTGLLPAESRFLGILTESDKKGFTSYDTGITVDEAKEKASPDTGAEMPLVYEPSTRQDCEVLLNADHKDFWFVTDKDDWKSITVPNDSELSEYAKDGFDPAGIVMVCLMKCKSGQSFCACGPI